MNHISLKTDKPRFVAKSPTALDAFRPLADLVSYSNIRVVSMYLEICGSPLKLRPSKRYITT